MPDLSTETLIATGFVDVAAWHLSGESIAYELNSERLQANATLMEQSNVLYAFASGDEVSYIGKTTRSAKNRFSGYRSPGKDQQTNLRCNKKIRETLKGYGKIVRILIFAPISDLRYREFEINLAAGLEDALIKAFKPPWNGSDKGKSITEEAEREKAEEKEIDQSDEGSASATFGEASESALGTFQILLGKTYYNQGFINPGKAISDMLGGEGEPIQIRFGDGADPVLSTINRTANPNGTVRIVGSNRQIAEWIQQHFQVGDTVQAKVLDANHILLLLPKQE